MYLANRKTFLCALLVLIWACAHFTFAQGALLFLGEVNANNINVRCDSTPNSEVIYTLNKGVRVEVVREFFEWYKIRLLKTAPSYIKKRFVACLDETAQPVCRNARVINDRVNVRLKPSESSAILGKADKTDPVVILEQEKGWYKIEPIAKSFGWINKKFVNKLAETEEKTE